MPKVTFSKEDLLGGKQLTAGWRKLKVKEITEAPGKKDPTSTTWPCVFVVEEGPDIGVPIKHWFSEKQMERLSNFIVCFLPPAANGQIEPGKEIELSQTVGKSVMGYCAYDVATRFNSIQDFKPVGK